jgi:hypothetical protein
MTFKGKDLMDEIEKVRDLESALVSKNDRLKDYNNPLLERSLIATVEFYDQVVPGTQRLELKYNNDTETSVSRKKRLSQLIISFLEEELVELEGKIQNLYKDISNDK